MGLAPIRLGEHDQAWEPCFGKRMEASSIPTEEFTVVIDV